ncbi:uncharacterized protein LOC131877800 [Tigriopus californicus]|uniref:uncharacterized protein LOC131877800 n=1 Tax=Tigriopus californicus TaxID=6832 RepID=UPI0027DA999C|nr:uncharacterized protein LOC131877800 [Tigriopus californicus]
MSKSTLLKQMSYECPGLHGPGSRQDITRKTFQDVFDLLGQSHRLVIPLFQRRYCWSYAQITGWWRDTCAGTRDHLGIHNSGNVIMKLIGTEWILIDGQQRMTTTSLLVASIRDALLDIRVQGPKAQERYSKLLKRLQRVLFIGLEHQDHPHGNTEDRRDQQKQELEEGENLAFARLVPSYSDRKSYFSLIAKDLIRQPPFQPTIPSSSSASTITGTSFAESTDTPSKEEGEQFTGKGGNHLQSDNISVQAKAKNYFDCQVQALLKQYRSSNLDQLGELEEMTDLALLKMGVTMVNVLNDINMAQVFLWLQEKTLFGANSFLYNPSPGIEFSSSDLVRNLMMACVMKRDLSFQEEFYHAHWLQPIERHAANPTPQDLTKNIIGFIEHFWAKQKHRQTSDLEDMVSKLCKHVPDPAKRENVFTYAKFCSLYEFQVQSDREVGASPVKKAKEELIEIDDKILIAASTTILKDFSEYLRKV